MKVYVVIVCMSCEPANKVVGVYADKDISELAGDEYAYKENWDYCYVPEHNILD